MKKILWCLAALLSGTGAYAQQECGFDEMMRMRTADPQQARLLNEMEYTITTTTASKYLKLLDEKNISIPVVFHVLYTNTAENLPDTRLKEQLEILNRDFRMENKDTSLIAAPFKHLKKAPGIQFCLAQKDPSGKASTGIIRYSVSSAIDNYNRIKESGVVEFWDKSKYLNIVITDLAGGLNGYAAFPGSSDTGFIAMDYEATGLNPAHPRGKKYGRTLTHETGHFFGLRHIFGDGSCEDFAEDTPPQQLASMGFPAFPQVSTCRGGSGISNAPHGDLFYNYMDYTDDTARVMFTKDQCNRMIAYLYNFRSGLINSAGCEPILGLDAALGSISNPVFNTCGASNEPVIEIMNTGSSTITAMEIQYGRNAFSHTYNWTGSLGSYKSATVKLPAVSFIPGVQELYVVIKSVNGKADDNKGNDTLSSMLHSCHDAFPFLDDAESGAARLNNYKEELPISGFPAVPVVGRFYQKKLDKDRNTAYIGHLAEPLIGPDEGNFSMTLKEMNLSVLPNPYLLFDIGFLTSSRSSCSDCSSAFAIDVSTDCGSTYSTIYTKEAKTMYSECLMADLNTPLRKDSVSLMAFRTSNKVWIRFRSSNRILGFSPVQDVFLDNITIKEKGTIVTPPPPTDIPEVNTGNSISVFPVPADQWIQIRLNRPELSGDTKIRLYDNTGREVYHESIKAELQLNTAEIASGVYYLRCGKDYRTVIIQH